VRVRVAIQSTFNSQIAIRAKERKRNWFGFLLVERGQFEGALNELVDGLQITADVRIKPVLIWAIRNRA
jgi:hypothetical protein